MDTDHTAKLEKFIFPDTIEDYLRNYAIFQNEVDQIADFLRHDTTDDAMLTKVFNFYQSSEWDAVRDIKSPAAYIRGIILSWILEDAAAKKFNIMRNVKATGANRKLINRHMDHEPDLVNTEVISQYTDFINQNRYVDLRGSKLDYLIENKNDLLIIDVHQKKWMIVPCGDVSKDDYVAAIAWSKPVKRLFLSKWWDWKTW
jgi:hypothetical protein